LQISFTASDHWKTKGKKAQTKLRLRGTHIYSAVQVMVSLLPFPTEIKEHDKTEEKCKGVI